GRRTSGGDSSIISKTSSFNCAAPGSNPSETAHMDLGSSDARIVEEALALSKDISEGRVSLLSGDAGLLLLGKEQGIDAIRVPDSWLLPPEKDEDSRRMDALEKRISVLEKLEPQIEVSAYRNGS